MAKIRKVEGNLYELCLFASPELSFEAQADQLFQKGMQAENEGRIDEAMELYRQTLYCNSKMVAALVNIGTIEYKRRNTDVAEESFCKALEIAPDYSLAHFNLAYLLVCKGKRDQAIEHYIKALEFQSGNASAHFNLGLEYVDMGEKSKALYHLCQYLHYSSGDSKYWREAAQSEIKRLRAEDQKVVSISGSQAG